jgi:hypothetical protein
VRERAEDHSLMLEHQLLEAGVDGGRGEGSQGRAQSTVPAGLDRIAGQKFHTVA